MNNLYSTRCQLKIADPDGFTIIEVVLGSIVVFLTMSVSAQLWNSTQTGINNASLRAKLDNAITTRTEEIRHCALFYEIDSSLILNSASTNDCRDFTLDPNSEILYSTSNCGSLGAGFKTFLEANTLSSPTKNLLSNFDLQDYDSSASSITVNTSSSATGNILRVSISAPIGTSTFSKVTSFTPSALSSCP